MNRRPRILIVDDQYEKVEKIIELTPSELSAEYEHVSNSREALRKLSANNYDLLIIDLQIPEALGDRISPQGGKSLLEYVDISDSLNKPTHILGITSHKDSYLECEMSFKERGWSLICGMEDEDLIRNIVSAKIRHAISPPQKYDIAILTALEHTELEAVLKTPCNWIPVSDPDDCNIYYSGNITASSGKSISLIATSCLNMGIAQSSAITMKLCLKFNPDYIFMTGIAAGIKGKVNLGDVLIADPCWDWGSGKQTIKDGKPAFLSSPRQISTPPALRAKLLNLATKRYFLDEIYNNWDSPNRPSTALKLHLGPVATGAVVLEDPSIVEMIQLQHRETIGIEMEAYGLLLASSISRKKPPIALAIKSVCDFANTDKNDSWQSYAAYTSTQFTMKLIENELYPE